jgi:signal transduction histidine kinase
MSTPLTESTSNPFDLRRLLAYVAALELEINRERRHAHFVHRKVRQTVKRIQQLAGEAEPDGTAVALAEAGEAARALAQMLRELQEPPGYHPAHDQVVAIAVRPLAEQVFRWQQRLAKAEDVELRLDLATEHVEWFPARLRHILDNLIANALKYRDDRKDGSWVQLSLREVPEGYEFRVSDNGLGLTDAARAGVFDLFPRAAPAQAAGLGVGIAVVKLLAEQSNGTLAVDTRNGQGTTFVVLLPRYELEDFLL